MITAFVHLQLGSVKNKINKNSSSKQSSSQDSLLNPRKVQNAKRIKAGVCSLWRFRAWSAQWVCPNFVIRTRTSSTQSTWKILIYSEKMVSLKGCSVSQLTFTGLSIDFYLFNTDAFLHFITGKQAEKGLSYCREVSKKRG